jgi:PAS domain S-box-containing protein
MAETEVGQTKGPALSSAASAAFYSLEFIIVGAVFFGLVQAGLSLPSINPLATPVWPPSGFALAAVLLCGYHIWPAVLAGSLASYLLSGGIILETSAITAGTLLAALAGAFLIKRWSAVGNLFATPQSVAKFSFVCFVPTAVISSVFAFGASALANDTDLSSAAVTSILWWLADGTGTLIVAPVMLFWAMKPPVRFSRRGFLEAIVVFALAAAIGLLAFGPAVGINLAYSIPNRANPYRALLGFLVLLPLMRAGLQGNQRNVCTAALIFFETAAWGFAAGSFPLVQTDFNAARLLLLALSISTSLPALILSAAIARRQRMEFHLLSVHDQLRHDLEHTHLELDSAKRHFEILIEGAVDYAIFVLDTAGHVASWNNAAQKIMGYTTDEIVGKHFGIFFRPDERRSGEPNRALELAVQQGKCEVEGWRVRKNGTPFFVTGSISSIRNDAGTLLGFANVLRDATERRDAQEKLVQAREQLAMAQKMEAIGKLTGGVAHDFNNLLMIIGGNAQTFKRLLDPKLPRAIEAIQTAAKRGESLTRQLLTFSRRQHLSPTVVDLNASIKNLRTMIESSLRGNIVYKEDIEDGIWPVKVDLAELELAIVNIAVNARDAMPNGGTFTLSVHNVTADSEPGGEPLSSPLVSITFSDTGMGIPPNLLSKIFDPFFTTKEVGKGSGLGLSQVYGFAHQAGGTVKAESKVGQGTTITMFLPSCAGEQITDKDVSAKKTEQPQRPIVLIVDDSAEVAEVTSSLFEHLGYATVYQDSAEGALRLLADGAKIDLVFSDIVMPGTIDGVGLAREIRSRYPDLPVVLTTGYSDAAQAVPPNLRILRKPFDTDALRDFIQDITEKRLAS